jgi:hypothetical protein
MLASFLGVLPILTPPLCALVLSCAHSPILETIISLDLKTYHIKSTLKKCLYVYSY